MFRFDRLSFYYLHTVANSMPQLLCEVVSSFGTSLGLYRDKSVQLPAMAVSTAIRMVRRCEGPVFRGELGGALHHECPLVPQYAKECFCLASWNSLIS